MSFPRYPEYKDAGVEWVKAVPARWAVMPMYSLVDECDEPNVGMKESNLLSLSYGRIVNKDINSNDGLLPESFETYQIVEPNDIVLRLTDLQNDQRSLRSALVNERGIITSAYLAVRPRSITPNYLAHLLRAYDLTKVFYSMGGGLRQSMKFSDLKRMPVLVPSSDEQSHIANFLDRETSKIDALVAEQEQLITLLKEKRQAVISHAVTKGLDPSVPMKDSGVEWLGEVPAHWDVKQIRQITQILRGKFTHRPRNDPAFYDGDYPFIQTGDVTGAKRYITEFKQTLNDKGAAVSKEFPRGTLVMTIAANIGDVAVLDFPAYFPDSMVGLVPSANFDLMFLFYLVKSMKQPLEMNATISTQMNLNVEQIGSLSACCPPIDEQRQIAQHLDAVSQQLDCLIEEAQAATTLLQERRSALISAAVTGQIDVRSLVTEKEAA